MPRTLPHSRAGVYAVTHNPTGQIYIGSSTNMRVRWNSHRKMLRHGTNPNPNLQRLFNETSEAAFTFQVLEYVYDLDLFKREQFWMDSLAPTLNVAPIAGLSRGIKLRPESKAKIAANNRVRGWKPESSDKLRASIASKEVRFSHRPPMTEEGKRKIGDANRGRASARKGAILSAETREKIALGHRGKPLSPEHRAAIARGLTGKKRAPYNYKKKALNGK